ncbi:MAG: CP12 domain-containing protein [Elainellaceae cyanobacterium]
MTYTTTAPAIQSASEAAPAQKNYSLDTAWEAALEHARRLTEMFGTNAPAVAIAWETVEELQSARFRNVYPHTVTAKAAFIRYCEENPSAPEARIYD